MDLSIIIPVYNINNYIIRCLDSCIDQDYDIPLYEILIIDDGSTDNTSQYIQKYIDAHPRHNIRLIHQNNKGISIARNVGIQYTTGKYIWFVDGDDFIEPYSIKKLITTSLKDNLDVLWFKYEEFTEKDKKIIETTSYPFGETISGQDFFLSKYNGYHAVWLFLIKREYIIKNKLFFKEGIIACEDLLFTPIAICLANKIAYIDIIAYHYMIRESSISHKINSLSKKFECIIKVCFELQSFSINKIKNKKLNCYINNYIALHVLNTLRDSIFFCSSSQFYLLYKEAQALGLIPIKYEGSVKVQFLISLLNISSQLFKSYILLRYRKQTKHKK